MPEAQYKIDLAVQVSDQTGPGLAGVQAKTATVAASAEQLGALLQGVLARSASQFISIGSTIAGAVTGIGAGVVAFTSLAGAIATVSHFISESRNAWARQLEAMLQLDAVWSSMKRSIPVAEIRQYAAELQAASTFGDEAIIAATRILATFPNITDEMMKPAMSTMVDLAAFAGTSLRYAAITIGKASEGMTDALRRQGISLKATTKASKNFLDIIRDIDEQVKGQAEARAGTTTGKAQQLANAYGDVQEQVGRIQAAGFGDVFDPIITKLGALSSSMAAAFDAGQYDALIAKLQQIRDIFQKVLISVVDWAIAAGQRFREFMENINLDPIIRLLSILGSGIKTLVDWAAAPTAITLALVAMNSIISRTIGGLAALGGMIVSETAAIRANAAAWRENAAQRSTTASQPTKTRYGGAAAAAVISGGGALALGADIESAALIGLASGGLELVASNMDKISAATKRMFGFAIAGFTNWLKTIIPIAGELLGVGKVIDLLTSKLRALVAAQTAWGLAAAGGIGAVIGAAVAAGAVYVGGWRREANAVIAEIGSGISRLRAEAKAVGYERGKPLPQAPLQESAERIIGDEEFDAVRAKIRGWASGINADIVAELQQAAGAYSIGDMLWELFSGTDVSATDPPAVVQLKKTREALLQEEERLQQAIDRQREYRDQINAIQIDSKFGAAAKAALSFADAIKMINAELDTAIKISALYFRYLSSRDEISFQRQRAEVAANTRSQEEAEQYITEINLRESQKRIQIAQRQYAEDRALKDSAYEAIMARLAAEEAAAGKNDTRLAELGKERQAQSKKYNDERLNDEKNYTDVVASELKKQEAEIQQHYERLRSFREALSDAQRAGAQALRDIISKGLSESDRITVKFAEIRNIMEAAYEALPTAPQKAIELAEQARNIATGAVQDIAALKRSFTEFRQATGEAYFSIAKKGMAPIAAWRAEIQYVRQLQMQAQEAAAQGDLEAAQRLAAQASQRAQAIANAPKGVPDQQAIALAKALLLESAEIERNIRLEIIAREEARQKEAYELAQRTNEIQQAAIQRQIDSTNEQITALRQNTAALDALSNRLQQPIVGAGPPSERPFVEEGIVPPEPPSAVEQPAVGVEQPAVGVEQPAVGVEQPAVGVEPPSQRPFTEEGIVPPEPPGPPGPPGAAEQPITIEAASKQGPSTEAGVALEPMNMTLYNALESAIMKEPLIQPVVEAGSEKPEWPERFERMLDDFHKAINTFSRNILEPTEVRVSLDLPYEQYI